MDIVLSLLIWLISEGSSPCAGHACNGQDSFCGSGGRSSLQSCVMQLALTVCTCMVECCVFNVDEEMEEASCCVGNAKQSAKLNGNMGHNCTGSAKIPILLV